MKLKSDDTTATAFLAIFHIYGKICPIVSFKGVHFAVKLQSIEGRYRG